MLSEPLEMPAVGREPSEELLYTDEQPDDEGETQYLWMGDDGLERWEAVTVDALEGQEDPRPDNRTNDQAESDLEIAEFFMEE